ncbi:MAG: DNA polymerase III subunit delta [Myxococcota bacterium]
MAMGSNKAGALPANPKLQAALDGGCRVVYIHGDTSLLIERAVRDVEQWGVERCGLPAFNHGRWRASDDRAADAVVTARTVPMMADLRVVVLRELEQGKEALCEAVVEYMASPNPSTLFIAVAGTFPRAKKGSKSWGPRLVNAAKKSGFVVPVKGANIDRRAFAVQHAAELGVDLGRRQAELLVELVGEDLGRLAQELQKVATYVGPGQPVTGEALVQVCSALAEETVWELTSGIARRDAQLALRALHRLMDDGQEPHYLFAMVCMQLRKVLRAMQMFRAGASEKQVAGAVRLQWREVGPLKAAARHAPPPNQVLERLAQANRAMNSSPAGRHRVLESLVIDLCA